MAKVDTGGMGLSSGMLVQSMVVLQKAKKAATAVDGEPNANFSIDFLHCYQTNVS
jgi:hypothetical protein